MGRSLGGLFSVFLSFVFDFAFLFLGHLGFFLLFLFAFIGLATIFSHNSSPLFKHMEFGVASSIALIDEIDVKPGKTLKLDWLI